MPQYNVSSVLYARVTDVNLAIAKSNSGVAGANTTVIEDVILPPTLATGKISATQNITTVTGTETDFTNDYSDGQYLYYYSADGNPALLGQIESRINATTLTLVEGALDTVVNKNAGGAGIKLTGGESILIRVPVVTRAVDSSGNTTQAIIPNLKEWRAINSNAGENSINNPETSAIIRYSNPGDIVSVDVTSTAEEKNIPFTIDNLNVFSSGITSGTYWANGLAITKYMWFLINPNGKDGRDMPQSTMIKLFTKIVFNNGVLVGANTPETTLINAGYNLKF